MGLIYIEWLFEKFLCDNQKILHASLQIKSRCKKIEEIGGHIIKMRLYIKRQLMQVRFIG